MILSDESAIKWTNLCQSCKSMLNMWTQIAVHIAHQMDIMCESHSMIMAMSSWWSGDINLISSYMLCDKTAAPQTNAIFVYMWIIIKNIEKQARMLHLNTLLCWVDVLWSLPCEQNKEDLIDCLLGAAKGVFMEYDNAMHLHVTLQWVKWMLVQPSVRIFMLLWVVSLVLNG